MKPFSLLVLLALLVGCGSKEAETAPTFRVAYRLDGALTGARAIEEEDATSLATVDQVQDWGGPRIGCSMVNVSDADPSKGKTFVLSAVENYGDEHGAGVYLKVEQFNGAGNYVLDQGERGRAWVFDKGHIQACVRDDDTSCFQGVEGCDVKVTEWDFRDGVVQRPAGYPARVAFGSARGTFSCRRLVNPRRSAAVSIVEGSFHCRAQDWSRR